jgi:uncharacterized protein YdaU (DUF1376 family)
MSKKSPILPWFQFHISEFRKETFLITQEQKGAYIDLLCYCWENDGKIKNCPKVVKKVSKISQNKFKDVEVFFTEIDGYLVHEELTEMLEKQRAVSEKRSEYGRAGGLAKAKANAVANGKQKLKQTSSDKIREDIKENKAKALSKKKMKNDSLEKLSLEDIRVWLDGKRANGKYLTIDEERLLEKFKDYCLSKNPTYKNYVAAFRNSFDWPNVPQKGEDYAKTFSPANKDGKSQEALRAISRGVSHFR